MKSHLTLDMQVEMLEGQIEQAKIDIRRRDSINNLFNNPDFIDVFVKGYFDDFAKQTVYNLADPAFESDEDQKILHVALSAIAQTRIWLKRAVQQGDTAEDDAAQARATLEEIRNEGDEE